MEIEKEVVCLCQYSSNGEWIVGLFTIIGVFAGALINFAYRYFEKRGIKKAMTKSLFVEIESLRFLENKKLPETKAVLNEFQEMYQLQNFISSPSIVYFGQPEKDYYDLYQSSIHFLEQGLRNDVVAFYGYVKSINDVSKKIDDAFKRFYKKDKTVGGQDIIKTTNTLIKQMEVIDILGAEILSQLIIQYHIDEFKKSKENKQKIKHIQEYLKNELQVNNIVDVQKIAQKENFDLVAFITILLKTKRFEKTKRGLYRKIK